MVIQTIVLPINLKFPNLNLLGSKIPNLTDPTDHLYDLKIFLKDTVPGYITFSV